MKALFVLLFVSLSTLGQHQDHPAVHGMLLVGTSKFYASHLPMFHAPHDHQAIFEIDLVNKNDYLLSSKTHKGYHTLVPEPFVLTELKQGRKSFKAQIYQGHFERGGKLIGESVVNVKQILVFKKFKQEPKPSKLVYYAFGNAQEQFMAHSITRAPDFDHILQVSFKLQGPPVETLEFSSMDAIEVKKEIYFEEGDLSH